jgi:retinal rod rhodopsin-sensitive cGMP 3',5'-cyclic phosphodiesterase subunit delta
MRLAGMKINDRAEEILSGFKLNWLNLRDAESGKVLWQSTEDFSDSARVHEAKIPKSVLKCKAVSREINFTSEKQIDKFRLEQRVYLKDSVIEGIIFRFSNRLPRT